MTINTNNFPFFDDFSEDKNFYKILFKPGVAVQARELTQLQTQIQNQIAKFGDHVFQNGTVILGGERFFESDLLSIKIDSSVNLIDVNVSSFKGKTIVGSISGTTAIVTETSPYTSAQAPKTLVVKLKTGGGSFVLGESITWSDGVFTGSAKIQSSNAFSDAMVFSINAGVFYTDGKFVKNEAQSIIVDAYSNVSSKSIGFDIIESIIDADADESLLDLAQGSPNFSAPGADRYKIDLSLNVYGVDETPLSFIELTRIVDGNIFTNNQKTLYSELEKEFARRTFDESGSYTVRPFPISFIPHVTSAKVRPVIVAGAITSYIINNAGSGFTSTPTITITGNGVGATAIVVVDLVVSSPTYGQITSVTPTTSGSGYTDQNTRAIVSGDTNKFSVVLDSGKAYVKGFEFETTSQTYLSSSKARATESADNLDVLLSYGNIINTTNAFGVFDPTAFTPIELHNVLRASVAGATTKVGSAKVRFLKFLSGTVGSSTAIYKISLFDIVIDAGKFLKDTESLIVRSGATVLAGYDIDLLSKVGGLITGDVFLSGTDRNSLVFPLNHSFIKELKDGTGTSQNDYTFQRTFNSVSFTSGSATIQTNNGLERFFGGTGALPDAIKDQYFNVIVTAVGTSAFTVGQVLRFNTGATRSITGGIIVPATQHQETFNVGTSVGFTATIIATINANAQSEKTKSLQPYFAKIITTLNTTNNGKDSLASSDIYNVKAIYNTGNVNPSGQVTIDPITGLISSWGTVSTHTDVTSNYTIDNGQRDEYYDNGSIILTGTPPSSSNYLVIVYNYFTHSGNGFLSVGSYSIPYENIPKFTSPTSGVTYELRDAVDFRPRKADGGTALNNAQLPDPDFTLNTDYHYYVGRIDKVIATSGKSFIIKYGIPSSLPQVPPEESDGMTLYALEVPPYTSNLSQISVKYVENKRYTMRDIGKLEKRIDNIEYYTQLTLLEKQASDESITDATNIEKFKNGFFVDAFTSNDALFNTNNGQAWSKQIWGWWNFRNSSQNTWNKGSSRIFSTSVSDSTNVDYHASIDPFNRELRAEFDVNNISFSPIAFNNTKITGDLVSLNYSESSFIEQLFASQSINVNPYNVIAFAGNIKLNPTSDTWVDTTTLPTVNRLIDINTTLTPKSITTTTKNGRGRLLKVSTTSTTASTLASSSTTSLGSSVVDIQYAPFIRANTIQGYISRFKPSSRLYPFIEKDSLSSVSRPNTTVIVQSQLGIDFVANGTTSSNEIVSFRSGGISGTILGTATVGYYSPESSDGAGKHTMQIYGLSGTTSGATFVTGTHLNSASIVSITQSNDGDALLPDEFGGMSFVIDLPGSIYPSGERTIRLIDNIDNDFASTSSVGETKYSALGRLESNQETILTTRVFQTQVTNTTNNFYYDPLAQSFIVDSRANPNGVHVSSIDIFFRTKDKTVPVQLELRKMINGFPESSVSTIPFGVVSLTPDKVNISQTGLVSTNFKFDAPIHLISGEYAIILISNSNNFEVFSSEMGKTNLQNSQIISKQPYLGTLFKSQNASTWTAVQEEDLKFRINTATFATSGSVQFGINNNNSYVITGTTTNASPNITSVSNVLNLNIGDFVYGAGIPALATVVSVDPIASAIVISLNATASVTTTITVIPFFKYQTIHINSSNALPTGTNLDWSIKLLDASTGLIDTNFSYIVTDVDFDATSLKAIKPKEANGSVPSIILQAELSTNSSALSPIIDISGLSTIFAKNKINNALSTDELSARGGLALARHLTKKVTLADGFDASNLVTTLDAYIPPGTAVRVYYRTLPSGIITSLEDVNWIAMVLNNSVTASTNVDDFKELTFYPPNAFTNYGVPIDNPISPRFNTWQIKIVFVSANEAITPRVRDLRCISTDS